MGTLCCEGREMHKKSLDCCWTFPKIDLPAYRLFHNFLPQIVPFRISDSYLLILIYGFSQCERIHVSGNRTSTVPAKMFQTLHSYYTLQMSKNYGPRSKFRYVFLFESVPCLPQCHLCRASLSSVRR